jgi:hypothetical protein
MVDQVTTSASINRKIWHQLKIWLILFWRLVHAKMRIGMLEPESMKRQLYTKIWFLHENTLGVPSDPATTRPQTR